MRISTLQGLFAVNSVVPASPTLAGALDGSRFDGVFLERGKPAVENWVVAGEKK